MSLSPTPPSPGGLPLSQIVARLGRGVAEVIDPGPREAGPAKGADPVIDDVTIAEPAEGVLGIAGDLLLGLGVGSPGAAAELIATCAARGVEAVALRRPVTESPEARTAAAAHGVVLVAVSEEASWAHLAWLVREVLDRASTHPPGADDEGGEDLFALADACTALLGAPVTIEDTRSRVVAYSERHEEADPIRVSTILGRRAPAPTVAMLRSRGVFRHLARSDDPLFLPAAEDGSIGARHIIPTRVGDEWVGSIWAVVDAPLPQDRLDRARDLVRLVALHLLRLRTEAEAGRRIVADRVRAALDGDASSAASMPPPPWRAVILGKDPSRSGEAMLAVWESVLRRASWRQPQLALVEGEIVVVVSDLGADDLQPGSWGWLRAVVAEVARRQPWSLAAAGHPAAEVPGLAGSLAAARELTQAVDLGTPGQTRVAGPAVTVEEAWADLALTRALRALAATPSPDPLADLEPALVETLRVWLDHPADPRTCAQALHVHPNTVRYRMARVRELLDVDLTDPTTRLALSLLTRVDRDG